MEFTNKISEQVWKDRYCKNSETLEDNFRRVAKYCSNDTQEEKDFFEVMNNGLFFPAGRTMSNAGIGKNLTMNNCFVSNSVPDSMEGIFDRVKIGALTHKAGGGIGYDFSLIRPKDTPTSNDAIASGVVSFMQVFDTQTATVMQGSRRGANMGILNIYHPDIEDYLESKSYDAGKLTHFNLSIMVDDKFMEAVENNEEVYLHYPVYDEQSHIIEDESKWTHKRKIKAVELWDKIMLKAYNTGEYGVFFYDNLNKDNNTWYVETIICTNPCGEYVSGQVHKYDANEYMGACNLGSLFLHNFVENPYTQNAKVNYDLLKKTIFTAVKFLDNIIDINKYPYQAYKNYQMNFRTIGLGYTGLATLMTMLNIKYGSKESETFAFELTDFIASCAYRASIELAKEKGSFPFFEADNFIQSGFLQKHTKISDNWEFIIEDIKHYGIRNARILSVAPTGTLSLTFGNNCSSGCEPIFMKEVERKIKIGGQSEENVNIVKLRDYGYDLWKKTNSDISEDVFVTTNELTVDQHIGVLAAIAFNVDQSVSKTINIPTDYSFEDTKEVYKKCHKAGIKGCTIFRPNELRQGIFNINKNKIENSKKEIIIPWGTTISCSDDLIGKKRKIVSGCGNLHVQAWFDPIDGKCLEIFLSKGSTGGCNSFMISLSRMTSLALRTGTNFDMVINQLKSIPTCASYAVRTATKHDTSKGNCCPTALANALYEMQQETFYDLGINESENEEVKLKANKPIKKEVCPECGEPTQTEGGCIQCVSCGWSKCG